MMIFTKIKQFFLFLLSFFQKKKSKGLIEDTIEKGISETLKTYGRAEVLPLYHNNGAFFFSSIQTICHLLVAGGTGSGKTFATTQLLSLWARICQQTEGGVEFFFAEGKSSTEFEVPSQYLSNHPVASRDENHTIKPFELMVQQVYNLYQERVDLLKKHSCKDIFEYREKVGKLPRVFFVIDEFSGFSNDMGDFNYSPTSSSADLLLRILREARYTGITVVCISQSINDKGVPNALKNNLITKILFRLDPKYANYYSTGCDVASLKKGHAVLLDNDQWKTCSFPPIQIDLSQNFEPRKHSEIKGNK